jgi:hypothetical protein
MDQATELLTIERANMQALARTRRTFSDDVIREHLTRMIARCEARIVAATETLRALDTY